MLNNLAHNNLVLTIVHFKNYQFTMQLLKRITVYILII